MLYFKACPKCKGDIQFTVLLANELELKCLQCSWRQYSKKVEYKKV